VVAVDSPTWIAHFRNAEPESIGVLRSLFEVTKLLGFEVTKLLGGTIVLLFPWRRPSRDPTVLACERRRPGICLQMQRGIGPSA
jgi:hypothetical protein